MNRFLIPFFCFSLFSLLFSLTSCGSQDTFEDFIVDTILDDGQYQEATFEISSYHDMDTRCIPTSATTNQDILSESCLTNEERFQNMVAILAYDNKILTSDTIMINGEIKKIDSHPYMINLKKNSDYSLSLTYRFIKNLDPSKIELLFMSTNMALNTNGFPNFMNLENGLDNAWLNYKYLCNYCIFYKRHRLASYNNWNGIDTKITLKRNSAQIIVLCPNQNYDSKGVKWMNLFLNYKTSIDHISQAKESTAGLGFGLSDFSFGSYYLNNSKVILDPNGVIWDRTSVSKETSIGNQKFAIFGSNKIRYNNKDYYYFTPFSVFATDKASVPVTPNGEAYKYITLIGFSERNIPYNIYWSNLPLPEGGLQANKRYIYILNSSFSFWDNGPINKTRSAEDLDVVAGSDDFELIELDMDEPVPFETDPDA